MDGWAQARDVVYVLVRGVLWVWGLALCAVAVSLLVWHRELVTYGNHPDRPIDLRDIGIAAWPFSMGALLMLPFGWLASHALPRLLLQGSTLLLLAATGLFFGGILLARPELDSFLVCAAFPIPPCVAIWLISRHRRRQVEARIPRA